MPEDVQPATAAPSVKRGQRMDWTLVIAILGILVTMTILVNGERNARTQQLDQLRQDARSARRNAEHSVAVIDTEISRTKYILVSVEFEKSFQQECEEQMVRWSESRKELKARIADYAKLIPRLDEESIWTADLHEKKRQLRDSADADERLAGRFEAARNHLRDLLSLRAQKESIALDEHYLGARQRSFRKVGDRWVEYPEYAPGRNFMFHERSRDDRYIYLEDPSRPRDGDTKYPMLVRLPIHGGAVQWSYEESAWADLFLIEPIEE